MGNKNDCEEQNKFPWRKFCKCRAMLRVFAKGTSVAVFLCGISTEKATKFVHVKCLQKLRKNLPAHP